MDITKTAARGHRLLEQFYAGKLSGESLRKGRAAVQAYLDQEAQAGRLNAYEKDHLIDDLLAGKKSDSAVGGQSGAETLLVAAETVRALGTQGSFALGNMPVGPTATSPSVEALNGTPAQVFESLSVPVRQKLTGVAEGLARADSSLSDAAFGLQMLRLLKVPAARLHRMGQAIVEPFLAPGRQAGLSRLGYPAYTPTPDRDAATFQGRYLSRYEPLALPFLDARAQPVSYIYYQLQVGEAARVAAAAGNRDELAELLTHALRLREIPMATVIAQGLHDERALITVAMLALTLQFRDGNREPSNYLNFAIHALGRVQGAERKEARAILLDLAKDLTRDLSDPYIAAAAVEAAMATGQPLGIREYGTQGIYATAVKDREAQEIIRQVVKSGLLRDSDLVREALSSIGDRTMLGEAGQRLLAEGDYRNAIRALFASGDAAATKAALDAWISSGTAGATDYELYIVGYQQALGDREGLARSKAACEQLGSVASLETIAQALAGQLPLPSAHRILPIGSEAGSKSHVAELVEGAQAKLRTAVSGFDPAARQALSEEAKADLAGGHVEWAEQGFLKALDAEGLLAAADAAAQLNRPGQATQLYLEAGVLGFGR